MINQIKYQDQHAREAYSHLQLALAALTSARKVATYQTLDLYEVQLKVQQASNELSTAIARRTREILKDQEANNDGYP